MSKLPVLIILLVIIVVSVGGGAYTGYRYSQQKTEPQLNQLNTQLNNLQLNYTAAISENEVLKRSISTLPNVVKIGAIAPATDVFQTWNPFITQIIQPDINSYCAKLGYNVTFQFTTKDAKGQPNTHLQEVQTFKSMGINLVIGGDWSDQAQGSLSYVNTNNMLLISPSSTSPALAIANDRLFRMSNDETGIATAYADAMWSYGIKIVIIMHLGDSFSDPFVKLFIQDWAAKGGELAGDPIRNSYSQYEIVDAANAQAKTALEMNPQGGKLGALILAPDGYLEGIVQAMKDVEPLYGCTAFSCLYAVQNGETWDSAYARIPTEVPEEAMHLKMFDFNIQPSLPDSSKVNALSKRFYDVTGGEFTLEDATIYDTAWALAESVIEARSVDARVVSQVLPDVCYRLYGVSGWCALNQYGDRLPGSSDLWFYSSNSKGVTERIKCGIYNPDTSNVSWDVNVLGFIPAG